MLPLGNALRGPTEREFPTVVFSPVKRLPSALRTDLAPLLDSIPLAALPNIGAQLARHTLVAARSGFGAGFHWHNASSFLLTEGAKKWYMGPHGVRHHKPTHPAFYTSLSTHKCLQRPGELLYIPALRAVV